MKSAIWEATAPAMEALLEEEELLHSCSSWSRRSTSGLDASTTDLRRSLSFTSINHLLDPKSVRIVAPIGEGAFSRVFEGRFKDPSSSPGRQEVPVAVKVLKREVLKNRSECVRFVREAKVLTQISHR